MKDRLTRSLAALTGAVLVLALAPAHAKSKEKADPAGELRAGITKIVADHARASTMLAAVDEMEAAAGELDRLIAEERGTLGALLRDYGSSRASVDASLAEFNGRRETVGRHVLATHAALKAGATAEEWKKLRKLELDMITYIASKSVGGAAPSGKEG